MSDSMLEYDPRFSDVGILDGGILSNGYGIVPQKVMRDTTLPRDARMMYAYLMTFMNARAVAFPGVDLQIAELQMSRKKYYEMRGILEKRDLIRIGKGQRKGQRNAFNIYYFNLFPNPRRKLEEDTGNVLGSSSDPADANNSALAHDSGKDKKPQVAQQFQRDTVHSGTPNNWISNSIHTPNSNQSDTGGSSQPAVVHESQSLAASLDGRSEQKLLSRHKPKYRKAPLPKRPLPNRAEADREWTLLMRSTINRNLIEAGRPRYVQLLSMGYAPSEIQAAWDRVQLRAKRENRGPRYFPQLKRWLESETDDGARAMLERLRTESGGKVLPPKAPRTLSSLAIRDEAFGRVYWAYCDARQHANQRDADPERDPECVRLKEAMLRERDAAYERLSPQLE